MQKNEVFLAGFGADWRVGLAGLSAFTEKQVLAEEPSVPVGLAEEEAWGQSCPSILLRDEPCRPFPLLLPLWCLCWPPSTSSRVPQAVEFRRRAAWLAAAGTGRPCLCRHCASLPAGLCPVLHSSCAPNLIPSPVRIYKVLAPAVPKLGLLFVLLKKPNC